METILRPIAPGDRFARREMEQLLRQEGLCPDANLDYSCGAYDEEETLVATGSCFGSTIRCLAVARSRQNQGLLVKIVSHLLQVQASRGNRTVFLHTKCGNVPFFTGLGFSEIARVEGLMAFLENRPRGFRDYCAALLAPKGEQIAAIVMHANPFTLGHRHLVEQAARENDVVHLFLLSQESGPIPHTVRRKLVEAGIAGLSNVVVQETGPYMISADIFPSYFLKDQDAVIRAHAAMDLAVFCKIAEALGIQRRYVGQEPFSRVTGIYNEIMVQQLPSQGIGCRVIPRLEAEGTPISASAVRQAIRDGDWEGLRKLLPESGWRYFTSPEAEPVVQAIRREDNLIHY